MGALREFCPGATAVTGAALPLRSWPPPWREVETSWGKLKCWGWGWGSPILPGRQCWHAPSGRAPPAPSAGGKVHRGQRSPYIMESEDLRGRGLGVGLQVGWGGPDSLPSIRGGRQEPGSPGHSHPARLRLCGRESQSSWACPRPLPALPTQCAFSPSLPLQLEPMQAQDSPVGLLGVEVHASSEAHHHPQERVSLWWWWAGGTAQNTDPGPGSLALFPAL